MVTGVQTCALPICHDQCETVDVCGVSKFLCIKEPGQRDDWSDESMGDIRAQLVEILDGYGRADDLLELVDCFE